MEEISMQLDREYVSLILYKQRQEELIREAEQQRLVNMVLNIFRREEREDQSSDDAR
jgi:hypothetical protein